MICLCGISPTKIHLRAGSVSDGFFSSVAVSNSFFSSVAYASGSYFCRAH